MNVLRPATVGYPDFINNQNLTNFPILRKQEKLQPYHTND